jgi:hypothetical protein
MLRYRGLLLLWENEAVAEVLRWITVPLVTFAWRINPKIIFLARVYALFCGIVSDWAI